MIRTTAALAVVALGATAAYGQNTRAIAQRQATMKEYASAVRIPGRMLSGSVPFDLVAIQAALEAIEATAVKSKTVFPKDSRVGETNALPAAFDNQSDFFAQFDKLAGDARTARNSIEDEASFKAEWPKIATSCRACHRAYTKLR